MTVEAAEYITGLNELNPDGGTQYVYEGDDHLRLLKEVLKNSLPAIAGAVRSTHEELSLLVGFTYLGTAAARDAGNAIGNVCLLGSVGGVAALPAVDGSKLTNVQTVATTVADIEMEDFKDGWFFAHHMGNL